MEFGRDGVIFSDRLDTETSAIVMTELFHDYLKTNVGEVVKFRVPHPHLDQYLE